MNDTNLMEKIIETLSKIVSCSDLEMQDGDYAKDMARILLDDIKESQVILPITYEETDLGDIDNMIFFIK